MKDLNLDIYERFFRNLIHNAKPVYKACLLRGMTETEIENDMINTLINGIKSLDVSYLANEVVNEITEQKISTYIS